jgi:hypothetical protein
MSAIKKRLEILRVLFVVGEAVLGKFRLGSTGTERLAKRGLVSWRK